MPVTTMDVTLRTGLPQPAISVAARYLANRGWITIIPRSGYHPLTTYAMAIPISAILDALAKEPRALADRLNRLGAAIEYVQTG
jgi:predicted transcriptional regulator